MHVQILAFATAGNIVGAGPTEIELADDARVSDLETALIARHPELREHWPRLAIAVDGALVRGDVALSDGVEVALLPPVSGG